MPYKVARTGRALLSHSTKTVPPAAGLSSLYMPTQPSQKPYLQSQRAVLITKGGQWSSQMGMQAGAHRILLYSPGQAMRRG